MTAFPTTLHGAGRSTETASPHLVRATSPAKSRLTIRLPDLNSARSPLAASPRQAPLANPTANLPRSELAEAVETGATGQATAEGTASTAWLRTLPQKTLTFIRQPKFWLACVVAVAVQVVLAFAMTPAEDVPDGKKPTPGSAQPWQKAMEEPAARIVVPAAPVSVPDDHPDTSPAVTTPMGPALPFDATSDTIGQGSESETAESEDQISTARMADKHSPTTAGARVAGRPAMQTDGATLGGIAPLDSDVPPEKHETR